MKHSCLLFLPVFLFAAACSEGGSECDSSIAAPELQNLGLDIQSWDTVEGSTAGAFTFEFDNPDAPFTAFGTVEGDHSFVNIEFKPRVDAQVLSPINGVVIALTEQEPNNYEIHLKTESSSCYLVSLDHVSNVTLSVGDTVTAGQVLGNPGDWSIYAGQFEIQINDDVNLSYRCPVNLIAAGQQTAVQNSMAQLMSDWETMKSNASIFDEGSMSVPGCLVSSMAQ